MKEKVKDLICGMEFEKDSASASFEYKGHTYYFCSLGCKDKFVKEPDKFITQSEK